MNHGRRRHDADDFLEMCREQLDRALGRFGLILQQAFADQHRPASDPPDLPAGNDHAGILRSHQLRVE